MDAVSSGMQKAIMRIWLDRNLDRILEPLYLEGVDIFHARESRAPWCLFSKCSLDPFYLINSHLLRTDPLKVLIRN